MKDVYSTITRPWREPLAYADLVLWTVVFVIVAFIFYDMLRILASWMKQAAT